MAQATDKSIFMLPKLRDSKVKHGAAGKWNRQSATAFDDVARSIDVIVNTEVANVNSIPSMWAHPLALQSVLSSNDYNDRIRIPLINQWRGMLTAIALAPDFREVGQLTAKFIDLTDPAYRNNKFIQSLFRLAPSTNECLFALEHNLNPWLQSYVFCWNGRAIGMTSPSTIVCPAEDANWAGLPWFINGQVQSPERYLTTDQKTRLSRWLVYLRRQISADSLGIHNQISTLINEFIDVLGGDRNQSLDPQTELLDDETYFGILIELAFYAAILQPSRNLPEETTFFLPSNDLHFLRRPNAFPKADLPDSVKNLTFAGSPISVILPIDPEFFSRENAATLLKTLKVESLKANTILKFSIQIDGHNLEKQYGLKNENVISGLPVAEIWPNFTSPNWQIYYTYYSDEDKSNLSFNFPYDDIHEFESSKLYRHSSFPNRVTCLFNGQPIGVLPIQVPDSVQASGDKWTVGIDFGTSFTNVYKSHNDSDEKIALEGLHFSITDADVLSRNSLLSEDFIPLKQNFPIPSLLTEKNGRNKLGGKSPKADIIFDARIYQAEDSIKVEERQNFLIGNLKWSSLGNKKPMRLFVEQLALQISAQALEQGITTIQWSLSYPTAFSHDDKQTYVKIWNECSKKLSSITGLKYEDKIIIRSESLAIAHFFKNKKEQPLSNTACIDIGGGTTDVSIWELRSKIFTPVFQFSIQLAGRHLFSDIMKRAPKFLEHIEFTNDAYTKSLLQLSKKNKPDLFYSALDTIVKGRSDDWFENHYCENLEHDPRMKEYKQILLVGFAGLHYYIGLVINVLNREENKLYESGKPVNVYFGGNGSRLLSWLSCPRDFGSDSISNLLQDMVVRGSSFKPSNRTIYLSDVPKEEAACGLVVGKKQLGEPSLDENALIAGEPCTIGEFNFNWDDYIQFNEGVEEDINELQIGDLVNIPRFLYWLHKSLKFHKINIPPIDGFSLGDPKKSEEENLKDAFENNSSLWETVIEEMQESMALDDGVTTENIRLEPPFILALKALMDVLAKRWAKKHEK